MFNRVALIALFSAMFSVGVKAEEPIRSWAGHYIGAAFGNTDGDVDFTLKQPPVFAFIGRSPIRRPVQLFNSAADQSRLLAAGSKPVQDDGAAGGALLAGYNLQNTLLLIGIEIDASALDLSTDRRVEFCQSARPRGGPPVCPGWHVDSAWDLNWMISARGRVGVPMGAFLPYVTAGLAWANFDFRQSLGGPNEASSAASKIIRGNVLGVGLEYALDSKWVLSGEYLKTDFGNHHGKLIEPLTIPNAPGPRLALPFESTNDLVVHALRMGLKYKF